MRRSIRFLSLVIAVYFGTGLVVGNLPAAADARVGAGLATWVDLVRVGPQHRLGPFVLAPPRLADAQCSADGRYAALTFEAPITSERTLVLLDTRPPDPQSPTARVVATADAAGPVDAAWCGRVAARPLPPLPGG